jgi:hypothetical protein
MIEILLPRIWDPAPHPGHRVSPLVRKERDSRLPSARFLKDEVAAHAKDTPPGLSEIGCPAYGWAIVLAPYSKRAGENVKLTGLRAMSPLAL